ncbi:MAG: hypothetical protein ACD_41C00364G0006 [uncultured bacterium]|nr:MAG: hypothetical protein ACD_41C00364G0006 [uncultured bacterium]HBY73570.1 hypothetical protein [Candidatus Kerfeldbacteria bacterium]
MQSADTTSVAEYMRQPAVRDNLYFLRNDCAKKLENLAPHTSLLDVGCGSGSYAQILKQSDSPFADMNYTGTEINKKLVDICIKHNPTVSFIVAQASRIPLSDSSYDTVFCSGTVHYTLSTWAESISEMARVAKQYLIITRLPVTKYQDSFYVHQTVSSKRRSEHHFFIVINRTKLEELFTRLHLKILQRDYSSEEYNIDHIDEKIVLVQYLLAKQ